MADEDVAEAKPISIAEALKEGVRSASSNAATSIDDLDGASKSAVVLLAEAVVQDGGCARAPT